MLRGFESHPFRHLRPRCAFGRDLASIGPDAQSRMLGNVNQLIDAMKEKLGESVRLQADLAREALSAITRLRGTF